MAQQKRLSGYDEKGKGIAAYSIRSRLLWALAAASLGVVIAGFWNYHLVDGFGKEMVAGHMIGDTEQLSSSYSEHGTAFGFIFAVVAGLAATFTACNCVVFAMLPGLTCSREDGSPRKFALKTLGLFTLGVVLVCFLYGLYVGQLGPDRIVEFNERESRLMQAQTTFTLLGVILLAWGILSFGFLHRLTKRLPKSVHSFFLSPLTKAALMGVMVGFFAVGRPFPVFRDFLTYAASGSNSLYGGLVMAAQGIGQIIVMVVLFMLVLWLFAGRLTRWTAKYPERLELISAVALLAGGAYFVFYWGIAFAYDVGRWGFKLNWYG